MASPDFGLQMCPTRLDGHTVLFAHKVTAAQCQDRQRGHYHKCWTCQHNNAIATKNGHAGPKPAVVAGAGAETAKPGVRVG
jgi:hypothetical protein